METAFIRTKTGPTVAQHCRLAKKNKQKCRQCSHSTKRYFKPDAWSDISNVQKGELCFWHMMRNGPNSEPDEVSYVASAVFFEMIILEKICVSITPKEKKSVV